MASIAELLDALTPDDWRRENGFSPDIVSVQDVFWNEAASSADRIQAISRWIERHQPCLFGRLAARANAISFCVLTEVDLRKPDAEIRQLISKSRLAWRRAAYRRQSSAFVVLASARPLAFAKPDEVVRELAEKLGSLYLRTDVVSNVRYLERVGLEIPGGSPQELFEFKVGVDYFSVHADKRWWHDHRIPGGIAFSMNSPGHLVRSGQLEKIVQLLNEASGAPAEFDVVRRIDSAEKALEIAMRTIWTSTQAVSGKATWLIRREENEAVPECARDLPKDLRNSSCRAYQAYYDTDWTLRTDFFRPDVTRPSDVPSREMDFTYFYDRSADNEDADLIEGVQVREHAAAATVREKRNTVEPRIVQLSDDPTLAGIEGPS